MLLSRHGRGEDRELLLISAMGSRNGEVTTTQHDNYDDPLADVFDSNDTSSSSVAIQHHGARAGATSEDPSDIPRLRSTHVTNGYREGIAKGKESTIQAGFDEGYALGAEFGMVVGRILGLLAGIEIASDRTTHQDKAVEHESLAQSLLTAQDELATETLFGPKYFNDDGVWTYAVMHKEESEVDVTFRMVATSHPLIVKWLAIVSETVRERSLSLQSS